jgi:hypothetical protein
LIVIVNGKGEPVTTELGLTHSTKSKSSKLDILVLFVAVISIDVVPAVNEVIL